MKRISRRALLCGAGGIGLALPMLELMRPRVLRAQTVAPRRIMFVFQANGDHTAARFAGGADTNFELGDFLRPLEPYKRELLFLNRLHRRFHELPQGERADNHQQGGSSLAPWASGAGSFPIGGTEDQTIGYVQGPSADYAIGDRVLEQDPTVAHRHLVYRVGSRGNNIWNLHSHAGPVGEQNPVAPEADPYAAYARLFASFDQDPAADAAHRVRVAKRGSALDLVSQELVALEARLGPEDRSKLQQHAEALRDIERNLSATLTSQNAACAAVDLGEALDPYSDDNHAQIGEIFFKISTLALACDQTRCINFNWSGNTSNRVYRNLGLATGHHDISHESGEDALAMVRQIHAHLWTQNTKLYDLLKNTPDGEGTLWDHTLIVHWNELGQGDSHSINDALVVLAGGAHQYFDQGRLVDYQNQTSFSDMLVTCFHYMGFDDVTTFGDERLRLKGELTGVT